jgi:hypothetical protein
MTKNTASAVTEVNNYLNLKELLILGKMFYSSKILLDNSSSTEVQHLTTEPEIKGLGQATSQNMFFLRNLRIFLVS